LLRCTVFWLATGAEKSAPTWRELHTVAPLFFCPVKCFIGCVQQEGRILIAWVTAHGHASAHRNLHISFAGVDRFSTDLGPNSFGQVHCAGGIVSGHDKEEFFPSVPADRVVESYTGTHSSCCFAQDRITDEVSVGIVDAFEVVQVGEDQGYRRTLALSAGQFASQGVQGCAVVPQARQGIVARLELESVARGDQRLLQGENARPRAQAGLQLIWIEGLGQVVVHPRLKCLRDVLFPVPGSQQQNVGVGLLAASAN
jgi:hypothetical protein